VYQPLLRDARLLALLLRIDQDLARTASQGGCQLCGGPLHSARFPRKVRAALDLGPDYSYRFSFCCAREGCRSRLTPPSVRFLGRKVYLGAVIVVVSALAGQATPAETRELRAAVGVSRRTLARWRRWWRCIVPQTRFWRVARGVFRTPVDGELPASLLERIDGNPLAKLVAVLRFLSPITTGSSSTVITLPAVSSTPAEDA
jgi:hypothetical protein